MTNLKRLPLVYIVLAGSIFWLVSSLLSSLGVTVYQLLFIMYEWCVAGFVTVSSVLNGYHYGLLGVYALLLFSIFYACSFIVLSVVQSLRYKYLLRKCSSATAISGVNFRYVDSEIPIAMTLGVFKPEIYVSKAIINTLSNEELKALLYHEQYHRDNHHQLSDLCVGAIQKLLFYVPLVFMLKQSKKLINEYSADTFSARYTSSETLKEAVQKVSNLGTALHINCNANHFNGTRKLRVKFKTSTLLVNILSFVLLAIALTATIFTNPHNEINAQISSTYNQMNSSDYSCCMSVEEMQSTITSSTPHYMP